MESLAFIRRDMPATMLTIRRNNEKLLCMLDGVTYTDRRAKFVSVITIVFPDGETLVARGECTGHIIDREEGEFGLAMIRCLFQMDIRGHLRRWTQRQRTKSAIEQRRLKKWRDC